MVQRQFTIKQELLKSCKFIKSSLHFRILKPFMQETPEETFNETMNQNEFIVPAQRIFDPPRLLSLGVTSSSTFLQ